MHNSKSLFSLLFLFTFAFSHGQCWKSLSLGLDYYNGIKTDGSLWTWGANDWGVLGNGAIGIGLDSDVDFPTQIGTSDSWNSISSYHSHTIAIKEDGTLWGWGIHVVIAPSTLNNSALAPAQIGIETDWATLSAGGSFSLALKAVVHFGPGV